MSSSFNIVNIVIIVIIASPSASIVLIVDIYPTALHPCLKKSAYNEYCNAHSAGANDRDAKGPGAIAQLILILPPN